MNQVNERSTAVLTLAFRNVEGQLQDPLAVTYRIDDRTTGQQIRAWTAATPAANTTIVLSPDDNVIVDDSQRVETRVLTFVASYGPAPADQITGQALWVVKNLRFLN